MRDDNFTIAGIKYILEKKGWIDIPATGVSMFPLIKDGDICRFISLEPDDIKKGDIMLFLSNDGHLVGHRYYHSFIKSGTIYHSFKGDTNYQFDSPVLTNQLIGKLIHIKKRAWHVNHDGRFSRGWGRLVLAFPILPRLCRRYLSLIRYMNKFGLVSRLLRKTSSKEYPHVSN